MKNVPSFRLPACLWSGMCVLSIILVSAGPTQSLDDRLDREFGVAKYLVHHSGRNTMGGYQALNYYSLESELPQNGTMLTPDGNGGTFTDFVEAIAGPFFTLRQVCEYVESQRIAGAPFDLQCPRSPEPSPAINSEQAAPVVEASNQRSTTDTGTPKGSERRSFSDWWYGLSDGQKWIVLIGAGLTGWALWRWLFGVNVPVLTFKGKWSTFGGPNDEYVKETNPNEGLALIVNDQQLQEFKDYFLPGTKKPLLLQLNPDKFYIACRWPLPYDKNVPRAVLVKSFVAVSNLRTGKSIQAKPVDWGPHETETDKTVDLSPGAARALELNEDDEVQAVFGQ